MYRLRGRKDGMHHGEIDATLAAFDADGKVLNSIFGFETLKLTDAEYAGMLKTGFPMH